MRETPDYPPALNGVQVEHRGPVTKIAAAVDTSARTIRAAIDAHANMLLVHHGLFWGGLQPLTGPHYARVRLLLDHDVALYSAHLPLDAHPTFGNSVLLAREIGLEPNAGFARHETIDCGVRGESDVATAELISRLNGFAKSHGGSAIASASAPDRRTKHWAICSGAGVNADTIREAVDHGVDTLISGEGPHWSAVDAEENGPRDRLCGPLRHGNAWRARARRTSLGDVRRAVDVYRRADRAVTESASAKKLSLHDISKRFGTTLALDGARLDVRAGTIHALLGENGAGKTTLMRLAFGMLRPDAGTIAMDGIAKRWRSSADAIAAGIGMVHQHFLIVPAMTVAENVALGDRGLVRAFDPRAAADRVRRIGAETGLVLDPLARAADLAVGAQQRLEIVKALAHNAIVLILDEPTAVLSPAESKELYAWLRSFVAQRQYSGTDHAQGARGARAR